MTTILILILVVLLIATGLMSRLLGALGTYGAIAIGLYLLNRVFGLSYEAVMIGGLVLLGIGAFAIWAVERRFSKPLLSGGKRGRAEREQQRQRSQNS